MGKHRVKHTHYIIGATHEVRQGWIRNLHNQSAIFSIPQSDGALLLPFADLDIMVKGVSDVRFVHGSDGKLTSFEVVGCPMQNADAHRDTIEKLRDEFHIIGAKQTSLARVVFGEPY